jgi:hypothetical protein
MYAPPAPLILGHWSAYHFAEEVRQVSDEEYSS